MRAEVVRVREGDKVFIYDAWGDEPPIVLYFPPGVVEERFNVAEWGIRYVYKRGYILRVEITAETGAVEIEADIYLYEEDYDVAYNAAYDIVQKIKDEGTIIGALEYGPFLRIVVIVKNEVYSCFIEDIHRPDTT